jgi:two-component system, NtrC family, response regulator HydG
MSKARVFIVDDDRDLAESLAEVLEARGYEVELAHSGEDGVARFRQSDFDLVFMDVKLPGMNGVESFFEFRKIRPEAKVVMMTGYSVEQLLTQAIENGALAVLNKPYSVTEILAVLERIRPRGTVLVADDDADFASSIEPILTGAGFRVRIARDGEEAIRQVSAGGIDCLVLDVKLPGLDGIEVFLQLKRAGKLVPTVIITAFAPEETEAFSAVRAMAGGFLMKPFNPAHLLSSIAASTR